jgi:hypothetical protein
VVWYQKRVHTRIPENPLLHQSVIKSSKMSEFAELFNKLSV